MQQYSPNSPVYNPNSPAYYVSSPPYNPTSPVYMASMVPTEEEDMPEYSSPVHEENAPDAKKEEEKKQ